MTIDLHSSFSVENELSLVLLREIEKVVFV